jgi:hypothetical protein
MGLGEKSEWGPWAQAWGFTHRPQRGGLVKNELITGARQGYLVQVGWGGEYGADLIVLVRFPKSARDPKTFREQLLAHPSVESIPGWKGRAGGVTVDASGTALIWQHSCSLKRPKTEQIQQWVEQILKRLAEVTPGFTGLCEQCNASGVTQYVLLDSTPVYLCSNCQTSLVSEGEMHQRKYERAEANYGLGAVYGAAGAVVGGTVWALLAIVSGRIFAIVAIGIAYAVAWAYVKGAEKIDTIGKLIGAVLTLGGIAVGDIIFYAYVVHQTHPEVPFHLGVGLDVFLHVLAESPRELAGEIVFGLVGLWYVFRYLEKPKFKPTIEQAPSS